MRAHGIIVALHTPLTETGEIHQESLRPGGSRALERPRREGCTSLKWREGSGLCRTRH